MFTPLLVALALAANSPAAGQIFIVDDQPTVAISFDHYSLARPGDLRSIRHRIGDAAQRVCDRGYRGVAYLETVACVKAAIADGNAQLKRIQAHASTASPLITAMTMAAPSK